MLDASSISTVTRTERWAHHSQIRRALGLSSLDDRRFLVPGFETVGSGFRMQPLVPAHVDRDWALGDLVFGPAPQAAAILTRAYTPEEVQHLLRGPSAVVERLAAALGRT
jgi:hypothetical protein